MIGVPWTANAVARTMYHIVRLQRGFPSHSSKKTQQKRNQIHNHKKGLNLKVPSLALGTIFRVGTDGAGRRSPLVTVVFYGR